MGLEKGLDDWYKSNEYYKKNKPLNILEEERIFTKKQ